MTGGVVNGGIYGGSNASGTISGNVTMKILGGQVGSVSDEGTITPANIHGGGYGENTIVTKNVDITIGATNQTTDEVEVYGDVYGGSALGQINCSSITDVNGNITGYQYTANTHTNITLNKGIINGSLYGGSLGQKNGVNGATKDIEANVYGPVTVMVYGGSVIKTSTEGSGGVYGGNNLHGSPQGTVTVDIYGTDPAASDGEYALHAVYGGGNRADYLNENGYPKVMIHKDASSIEYVYGGGNAAAVTATDVTIWGGNVIGNVFGGGNGTTSEANIQRGVSTKIYGGTIGNVFGGSNTRGDINGNISVEVNPQGEGENAPNRLSIGNIYGGGNKAASEVGNINIVSTGDNGRIENVYGGANQADVTGDIDLYINAGNIGNVFGGNNTSGNVNGKINVTIGNNISNNSEFSIDNVYGGGNLAPYTTNPIGDYPMVKMMGGIVKNTLYGGGLGATAIVTGNPQILMTGGTVGHIETVDGKEIVYGDLFGGGNEAPVQGNTNVNVYGGEVKRNVYGGGNKAVVLGTTKVIVGSSGK